MKSLEKIIINHKKLVISDKDLIVAIRFNKWANLNRLIQHHKKIVHRVTVYTEENSPLISPNPEDLFVGLEFNEKFKEILKRIHSIVGDRDFNIFVRFYLYRDKQADIAKDFDISRSAVSMVVLRVNNKIRRYISKHPDFGQDFKEYLLYRIDCQ